MAVVRASSSSGFWPATLDRKPFFPERLSSTLEATFSFSEKPATLLLETTSFNSSMISFNSLNDTDFSPDLPAVIISWPYWSSNPVGVPSLPFMRVSNSLTMLVLLGSLSLMKLSLASLIDRVIDWIGTCVVAPTSRKRLQFALLVSSICLTPGARYSLILEPKASSDTLGATNFCILRDAWPLSSLAKPLLVNSTSPTRRL